MSDLIETVWMGANNVYEIPSEIRELIQKLAYCPSQKNLETKFFEIKNHLWDTYDLTLSDAKVCYNTSQLYQLEWWLLGKHGQVQGTLVFGRKLPTIFAQPPLRKFWIRRRRDRNFGEITPALLINSAFYDSLYFHNHDEAIRLNQYSQCDGDIVYRHESGTQTNPDWDYTEEPSR
jgi:hypothetical protein